MGSYVVRNGKSYYKADDGKLYQNYRAAAAANNNPLSQVQRFAGSVWNAADRALGGFLPGGASISTTIAPAVRNVSQSPTYRYLRDNIAVPLLDRGMEVGLLPAKEGMFLRFLSGTEKSMTRIPAETRAAEALVNNRLTSFTKRERELMQGADMMETWLDNARKVKEMNEMYNMHGEGRPASAEEITQAGESEKRLKSYIQKIGLSEPTDLINSGATSLLALSKNYDPMNYTVGTYIGPWNSRSVGESALRNYFTEDQNRLISRGLSNTLGRYRVKEGKTEGETYDFNSYNAGKALFAPKSMVGGVIGDNAAEASQHLGDRALGLADKFGFIHPGSGYPVEFQFRRK